MRCRALVVVGLLVVASGCAKPDSPAPAPATPQPAPAASPPEKDADFAVVRTFFGTDRNLVDNGTAGKRFGNDRATVSYGMADVSIPRDHKMGELEHPSIWQLEFREDPSKHVVLMDLVLTSREKFFRDMAQRLLDSGRRDAFIFVHGYNVTFEDAARRTAQIWYDLGFKGVPAFYSWPSQGATSAYTVDEQNIEWAQTHIKEFLRDFLTRSEAQSVYLIAHSMGNRAVTRAVASLMAEEPALRPRLKEIILLYASSADLALAASRQVHGYRRAGDSREGIVIIPGIETIDASAVDTDLLGHSYIAQGKSILSDVSELMLESRRADRRSWLKPVDVQTGRYWRLAK
jgi:esterase/lipase superfamily enzyme